MAGMQAPRRGAGDGIRTRDINLGKVALYHLSYSRFPNRYSRSKATALSNPSRAAGAGRRGTSTTAANKAKKRCRRDRPYGFTPQLRQITVLCQALGPRSK